MEKIFPAKLKQGDLVRVVSPSRSMSLISEETQKIANARLEKLGLKLSFSKNVSETDEFISSSVKSRVADLHEAFHDPSVKCVLTTIGGYNANQLLKYIDWEIIRKNPKVFCGFSDITVLNNAIFTKTGLVTYSGPHYSTLGKMLTEEYTID